MADCCISNFLRKTLPTFARSSPRIVFQSCSKCDLGCEGDSSIGGEGFWGPCWSWVLQESRQSPFFPFRLKIPLKGPRAESVRGWIDTRSFSLDMGLAVSRLVISHREQPSYPNKYVLTLERRSSGPVLPAAGPEGTPRGASLERNGCS